ncbi:MAG: hypothetical protein AAB354_14930 [candidate division KSB1 bacterium]
MSPQNIVVEWAPFEIVAGADEEKLLQASAALQEDFLAKQKGFIRRELLKGKDKWVDLVYWACREDAERAVQNAASSPACHAYFQYMVAADHHDPGAGVLHFNVQESYSA